MMIVAQQWNWVSIDVWLCCSAWRKVCIYNSLYGGVNSIISVVNIGLYEVEWILNYMCVIDENDSNFVNKDMEQRW